MPSSIATYYALPVFVSIINSASVVIFFRVYGLESVGGVGESARSKASLQCVVLVVVCDVLDEPRREGVHPGVDTRHVLLRASDAVRHDPGLENPAVLEA